MNAIIALHTSLPADGIPDWVHLVPAGRFSGADGRGPFMLEADEAVIAASMAGGKLAIDENHATDIAAPEGRPSPARGWITSLEHRADGLWGKVDWTPSGKALLADKSYRALSPVIMSTADGQVVRVLRAALTNDPNLTLATLHAQNRSPSMDLLPALRTALGLGAEANEAAVIAAATSAHAAIATHAAEIKAIAEAAGAADATTGATLVTHLNARNAEGDPAQLKATVVSLQSQINAMTAASAKVAAEAAVDKAIADGKPVRALRDHYVARHMKDAAGVQKEIDALPSLHSGGIVTPPKDNLNAGATVAEITEKASLHQKAMKDKGIELDWGSAVRAVTTA